MILTTACAYEAPLDNQNRAVNINQTKAESLIEDGAILIDVRTRAEYNAEHIEGSVNLAAEDLSSIDYDKESVIIVYCRSGSRSHNAANALVEMGYKNVYDLGAISIWEE